MITKVSEVMANEPVTVSDSATFGEAAEIFATRFVSDLHVVDKKGRLIGVVPEGDLLRYTLPNFDELTLSGQVTMEEANKLFLASGKVNGSSSIKPLIIYEPIVLDPDDELLKAAVIFIEKNIRSLPVVKNEILLGVVSRASIIIGMIQKHAHT